MEAINNVRDALEYADKLKKAGAVCSQTSSALITLAEEVKQELAHYGRLLTDDSFNVKEA